MTDQVQRELPKYKYHKVVHALKIKSIRMGGPVGFIIEPVEEGYVPFDVSMRWVEKYAPSFLGGRGTADMIGGYYVVYEDGYCSFSPQKAFEEGYTRI